MYRGAPRPLTLAFPTHACRNREPIVRRRIALVITFVAGLIASAFAQKAEIEAANAKWIEFFNKGDFAGIASLYADDATAFTPGSGMVKGSLLPFTERSAITHAMKLTVDVVASRVVVDAIAVAHVESVFCAVPPDRVLHKPREGLWEA